MNLWSDLNLVLEFFFDVMSGISTTVMNSILVFSVVLWLTGLVIKVFKKVI